MKVTYDLRKPPYEGRVAEVMVRCTECPIPQSVPLKDDVIYRLIVTSFIGGGGDGYSVLKQQGRNYVTGKARGHFCLGVNIIFIKPLSKQTLRTYFPGGQTDTKYAFCHARS